MRGLERLLELQELDLSIDRLEARREALAAGQEIQAARSRMQDLENRIGELRMGLDSQGREQTRLEGEASSLDMKIQAEEKRLYDGSVANPKELESIQAEVTGLRGRKARIEEEILEQMERGEALTGQLGPLEAEVEEARARLAEVEASSETELAEIAKALAERRGEREALVPMFDEELLELYEDLRAQKKGVGAALLENGVCNGCRQQLSPLELERVRKTEGIRRCEYCRRILILA